VSPYLCTHLTYMLTSGVSRLVAGGLIHETSYPVSSGSTYTVTVGGGGIGGAPSGRANGKPGGVGY
jgi:hypothetical protein